MTSVKGKIVVVQTNFSVPEVDVPALLPRLNFLIKNCAKIVVVAPAGELQEAGRRLSDLLARKFVTVTSQGKRLPDYHIPHLFLLENPLLLEQMKEGDVSLMRTIPDNSDILINETESRNIQAFESMLRYPKKPVVLMLGGINVAKKLAALRVWGKVADYILLGGGMANLFLKIAGYEVGKSFYGKERGDEKAARELWRMYQEKIYLPIDVVVAKSFQDGPECVGREKVRPGQMILDIGPESILYFSKFLKQGNTLIWSGPLGYMENRTFAHGTRALARLFASRTKTHVAGLAGGASTVAALYATGMQDNVDHLLSELNIDSFAGNKI